MAPPGCPCRDCCCRREESAAALSAFHALRLDRGEGLHWEREAELHREAGLRRGREVSLHWDREAELQWEREREAEYWHRRAAVSPYGPRHSPQPHDLPAFTFDPLPSGHPAYPEPSRSHSHAHSHSHPDLKYSSSSSGYQTPRQVCPCSPYQPSPSESRGYASGYQSESTSPLPPPVPNSTSCAQGPGPSDIPPQLHPQQYPPDRQTMDGSGCVGDGLPWRDHISQGSLRRIHREVRIISSAVSDLSEPPTPVHTSSPLHAQESPAETDLRVTEMSSGPAPSSPQDRAYPGPQEPPSPAQCSPQSQQPSTDPAQAMADTPDSPASPTRTEPQNHCSPQPAADCAPPPGVPRHIPERPALHPQPHAQFPGARIPAAERRHPTQGRNTRHPQSQLRPQLRPQLHPLLPAASPRQPRAAVLLGAARAGLRHHGPEADAGRGRGAAPAGLPPRRGQRRPAQAPVPRGPLHPHLPHFHQLLPRQRPGRALHGVHRRHHPAAPAPPREAPAVRSAGVAQRARLHPEAGRRAPRAQHTGPSAPHHVTFSPSVGEAPPPTGPREGSLPQGGEAQNRVSVKFVQDSSRFWYKPGISRDQAIAVLKEKEPGTFLIRDSNSFQGAYGLALKVATPPANVNNHGSKGGDPLEQLVRHFLIETGPRGVKIKGCQNEPHFGSLSALVYQHSITPISLPCALRIPEKDLVGEIQEVQTASNMSTAADLLKQGAACNVLYLNSVETESLTGPQAISKATSATLSRSPRPPATVVHFKVSAQGITLTDSQHRVFFRRHYPVNSVTFSSVDPQDRRWTNSDSTTSKMFGFVAKKQGSVSENVCHLFAELDPEQPASAIVNFINKVMLGPQRR
ncbi:hypothetical protein MATL_G00103880 [Megalops atlanticus]|uniref:SH2 domain-containing protein n=1 Tax=Megalops atlanticus TaxID=7932 RepID=A0A9D3T662_MEGAT|nr:hypothetical protein MATL_G00103880 [Megalops atlanticus]